MSFERDAFCGGLLLAASDSDGDHVSRETLRRAYAHRWPDAGSTREARRTEPGAELRKSAGARTSKWLANDLTKMERYGLVCRAGDTVEVVNRAKLARWVEWLRNQLGGSEGAAEAVQASGVSGASDRI